MYKISTFSLFELYIYFVHFIRIIIAKLTTSGMHAVVNCRDKIKRRKNGR